MGRKGDASSKRILSAAKELFAARGYSSVTMKDISIAAKISRGGLYRHFPSTEVIFSEIIRIEQETALAALQKAKVDGVSPAEILDFYLKYRMDNARESCNNIDNAISEFAANSVTGKEVVTKRADDCVKILTDIIDMGKESGVFKCCDSNAVAMHISWSIEGMCKHGALIKITEDDINAQLGIIKSMLV